MFYHTLTTLLSLASIVSAASETPTLYLVGDGTMANLGDNFNPILGWGERIGIYLLDLNVVNKAAISQSARSYTREGRWKDVQGLLKPGDFVVIEFGHDEAGSLGSDDKASVPGEGDDSQNVTLPNGTVELVHTWPHYIKAMIDGAKSKGATPIISSQTPNDPFANTTTIINAPTTWVGYASRVAAASGVPYVDHFAATVELFAKLGKNVVDSFYINDDTTHTTRLGANQVAIAFINGLQNPSAQNVLTPHLNINATKVRDGPLPTSH